MNNKTKKIVGIIFIFVGLVLLAKMPKSELLVTGVHYDPEYSAHMHPFNIGLQLGVLWGIAGAICITLSGTLFELKGLYCNAISLTLFDLFMFPVIIKRSVTYAGLIWEMDSTLLWKIYNVSSQLLILGLICVSVYGVWLMKREQKGAEKYRNIPAIALFIYTYGDILMKAFINPWYIYCSLAVLVVNVFIIALSQKLKTGEESLA